VRRTLPLLRPYNPRGPSKQLPRRAPPAPLVKRYGHPQKLIDRQSRRKYRHTIGQAKCSIRYDACLWRKLSIPRRWLVMILLGFKIMASLVTLVWQVKRISITHRRLFSIATNRRGAFNSQAVMASAWLLCGSAAMVGRLAVAATDDAATSCEREALAENTINLPEPRSTYGGPWRPWL